MNTSTRWLLAAGLASVSVVVAHARIDRVVEKSFPVTGAGVLRVETQGGGIRVSPSADSAVRITAKQRINASSEAEANELFKKLELTFEQTGNDVRVIAKYERQPSGSLFGSWPPVQVDFEILVPSSFATDLNTSGGAITVGDLNGKADLRTSGGAIKLGKMGGAGRRADVGRRNYPRRVARAGRVERHPVAIFQSAASPARRICRRPVASIKVDSVASSLRAHTSGGSIRANIAGPIEGRMFAQHVRWQRERHGGQDGGFRLDASTSGGGVDAAGLTMTLEKSES